MAKKSKLGQVQKLEEQIRELREKQKKIIEQARKEIGEYVMESWDVEDIEQAKKLINKFQDEAKASFRNSEMNLINNNQNENSFEKKENDLTNLKYE